jgi:hypothetical protein
MPHVVLAHLKAYRPFATNALSITNWGTVIEVTAVDCCWRPLVVANYVDLVLHQSIHAGSALRLSVISRQAVSTLQMLFLI